MARQIPQLSDSPWAKLADSLPAILLRLKENQQNQQNIEQQRQDNQKQQSQAQMNADREFKDRNADQEYEWAQKRQADQDKIFETSSWGEKNSMIIGGYKRGGTDMVALGREVTKQMLVEDNKLDIENRRSEALINYYNNRPDNQDNLNHQQKWQLNRIDTQITSLEQAKSMAQLQGNETAITQIDQKIQGLVKQTEPIFGIKSTTTNQALIETEKGKLLLGGIRESAGISEGDFNDILAPHYQTLYDMNNESDITSTVNAILKDRTVSKGGTFQKVKDFYNRQTSEEQTSKPILDITPKGKKLGTDILKFLNLD